MLDRIDLCHNIFKIILYQNFISFQKKENLKLHLHKAYVIYDERVFGLLKDPEKVYQYKKIQKENEKYNANSKENGFFNFKWFGSKEEEKAKEEIVEPYEAKRQFDEFEERTMNLVDIDDYSDIKDLKKYEITR